MSKPQQSKRKRHAKKFKRTMEYIAKQNRITKAMKTKILLTLFGAMFLSACADVSNLDACLNAEPYGFWSGLWHGWICPISLIGSLFSDDIAVYAINNTGAWYDFGFILGAGSLSVSVGRNR